MYKNMNSNQFDDEKTRDPIELKGKIKHVSYFKIFLLILLNIFQGLNLMYVQYLLFHRNIANQIYYHSAVVIYFISAIINMIFTTRIFIINKTNHFTTIFCVTFIFLCINNYFSAFKPNFSLQSDAVKIVVEHTVTLLFLFLQLPPFLLQIIVTKYAIQCKLAEKKNNEDQEKCYNLMIRANTDAGFTNKLEYYLRAAPQQILHVGVIFYNHGDITKVSALQQASILLVFVVMPWTSTSFRSFLKMQQQNIEMPWKSKIMYYLGRFYIMVSRILSIGGAVAFWPVHTGGIFIIHWITAIIWLWRKTKPTEFCNNSKFWHALICIVFGYVYFFTPMNLIDYPTRQQYIRFYAITFIQNSAASTVWFLSEDNMAFIDKVSIVFTNFLIFVCGILFTILYYKKFHPNKTVLIAKVSESNNNSLEAIITVKDNV